MTMIGVSGLFRRDSIVVWNQCNPPEFYARHQLERLRAKKPELERTSLGSYRIRRKAKPQAETQPAAQRRDCTCVGACAAKSDSARTTAKPTTKDKPLKRMDPPETSKAAKTPGSDLAPQSIPDLVGRARLSALALQRPSQPGLQYRQRGAIADWWNHTNRIA